MKLGASGYSALAAPEDGRTPPTSLLPSLTHYAGQNLHKKGQNFHCILAGRLPRLTPV